jgi:polysaccharide export outer membrane protein
MRKLWPVLGVLFFIVSMNACVAPERLYYFHDKLPGKDKLDTTSQVSLQRIQKNDRLTITVSSTDPALTAYLNPFSVQNSTSTTQQNNVGYLVNDSGNIEFPLLGQVEVAGLTTVAAAGRIRDKLSFYYKDLYVNVTLRGQVYFMNGRVGTPIPMVNERLTIFEAIAQSGSQDPYDVKSAVWLVRDSSNGTAFTQS